MVRHVQGMTRVVAKCRNLTKLHVSKENYVGCLSGLGWQAFHHYEIWFMNGPENNHDNFNQLIIIKMPGHTASQDSWIHELA